MGRGSSGRFAEKIRASLRGLAFTRRFQTFFTGRRAFFSLLLFACLALFWFALPRILFPAPLCFVLEDSQGNLLGASIASDGQWRFPMEQEVPEKFEKAILAFEDKRFYYHPGIDPIAFLRAAYQNTRAHHVLSGGSTLSMQVIRLSRKKSRTILQKALEMMLALRLELSYSKKEILALYAANAPFGTNVVGLQAASWRYFGRKPGALSWGEIASLAVLPNSPSLVRPGRNQHLLLLKRNRLLEKLFREKVIDSMTWQLASLEPVPDEPHALPQYAPHLLDRFIATQTLEKKGSFRCVSTIDFSLQQKLNELVDHHSVSLRSKQINNAAALVLDVKTGAVLAYVGNVYHPEDPALESHVDVIASERSPGSTLKPFLFACMQNEGYLLPNSLVPDVPTHIGSYSPLNFDLGYDGAVPVSQALSRSLNVPAVRMLNQYKYARFYDKLLHFGFAGMSRGADYYGLSLILGGAETNLWELCGAYSGMARTLLNYKKYGRAYDPAEFHPPVYEREKAISYLKPPSSLAHQGALDASSVWLTFQAMEEVARPGEEAWWKEFSTSRRVAWKTGTSFGFRDGWAIGVTPQYVVGVWVGNTSGEGRPGLTGISTAAPILFDIFHALPQGSWFEKPVEDMVNVEVCRQSGFRAGAYCTDTHQMEVSKAGLRCPVCPYHRSVHLNAALDHQVDAGCAQTANMQNRPWFVLPPVMEYYYQIRHPAYQPLPPYEAGCSLPAEDNRMDLIYPTEDARIYVPLEQDGNRGKVIFSAAYRGKDHVLYWNLDHSYLGSTTDFHQMAVNPSPGKHTLILLNEKGDRLERHFEILDKSASGKG